MEDEKELKKFIYDYFRKINFVFVENHKKKFKELFGNERANFIEKEWDKLQHKNKNRLEGNISEQTELYDFFESDIKISQVISEYSDYYLIFNSCLWILKHKDLFSDDILDVGCGNGILTCFIAYVFPKSRVLGIDRSNNFINVANYYKESLQLKNVEFKHSSLEDICESHSTLFSSRTMHENIGAKPTAYRFISFSEQIDKFGELYKSYLKTIKEKLLENGNFIGIERFRLDTDFLGMLKYANNVGLVFNKTSCELLHCIESAILDTDLVAFNLTNSKTVEYSNIFDSWRELAFNGLYLTEPNMEYILEKNGGELKDGYITYDVVHKTNCAIRLIKLNRKDMSEFYLYMANAQEKNLQAFPIDRIYEAYELLADSRKQDLRSGFKVIELDK